MSEHVDPLGAPAMTGDSSMHAEAIERIKPSRRLVVSLALSLAVFSLEAVGGFVTGSLALLGDATHVLVDVVVGTEALRRIGVGHATLQIESEPWGQGRPSPRTSEHIRFRPASTAIHQEPT